MNGTMGVLELIMAFMLGPLVWWSVEKVKGYLPADFPIKAPVLAFGLIVAITWGLSFVLKPPMTFDEAYSFVLTSQVLSQFTSAGIDSFKKMQAVTPEGGDSK